MKRILSHSFVLSLCLLLSLPAVADAFFGSSPVNTVKNGKLSFDTSTTVGNVLDNFPYFTKKEWVALQDQQKRDIVEFRGTIDVIRIANETINDSYLYGVSGPGSSPGGGVFGQELMKVCLSDKQCFLHSVNYKLIVQFTMTGDKSFNVTFAGTQIDNEKPVSTYTNLIERLYKGENIAKYWPTTLLLHSPKGEEWRRAQEARKQNEALKKKLEAVKAAGFIAISESRLTWSDAVDFCEKQGGRLPRINDSDSWAKNDRGKITHIDGFGTELSRWPSNLPDSNYFYWTGTVTDQPEEVWVFDKDGSRVNVSPRSRDRCEVLCVASQAPALDAERARKAAAAAHKVVAERKAEEERKAQEAAQEARRMEEERKAQEARKQEEVLKEALKAGGFIAMSESPMTWADAKIYCEQQGGRLPRINDSDSWDNRSRDKLNTDGFGAVGFRNTPWPSGLPDARYWTGTAGSEAKVTRGKQETVWLVRRDGGWVEVTTILHFRDSTAYAVCIPSQVPAPIAERKPIQEEASRPTEERRQEEKRSVEEPFPCRFDSYFDGELESATPTADGILIELLAGGDSMKYLVPKNAQEYQEAVKFVQNAQKADTPPEGAFLLNNNAICGFTPIFRDDVVLKSHKRDGDRYILSVCTDETSDCYTLRISPGNPLLDRAERAIKRMTAAPSGVDFNSSFEIMGIYKIDDSTN